MRPEAPPLSGDRLAAMGVRNLRKGDQSEVKVMPLYEYKCLDCETGFDALRAMADADAPIACPKCGGEDTCRMISLFFTPSLLNNNLNSCWLASPPSAISNSS